MLRIDLRGFQLPDYEGVFFRTEQTGKKKHPRDWRLSAIGAQLKAILKTLNTLECWDDPMDFREALICIPDALRNASVSDNCTSVWSLLFFPAFLPINCHLWSEILHIKVAHVWTGPGGWFPVWRRRIPSAWLHFWSGLSTCSSVFICFRLAVRSSFVFVNG